jgi:hypothetical protein
VNGRTFVGDGVYAQFDDLCFVLTTENGVGVTNRVVLDPSTLLNFDLWLRQLRELQGHEMAAHEGW